MKRRLTIARALINEPDLLLLDEPTTGLDPQARHLLWDRLYRLKQRGVTLVLTTHYMDEAEQLCDRLVVMDKARIVAEGSPARADRAVLDPRGDRAALPGRRRRRRSTGSSRPRRPGRAPARPGPPLRRGRRGGRRRGPPSRPPARDGPRPPLDARGRLPPADRPLADRIGEGRDVTAGVIEPTGSSGAGPATSRPATPSGIEAASRVFEHRVHQYRRTFRARSSGRSSTRPSSWPPWASAWAVMSTPRAPTPSAA